MLVTEIVDALHVILVAAEFETADGEEAGEIFPVVDVEVVQVGRLVVAMHAFTVEEFD